MRSPELFLALNPSVPCCIIDRAAVLCRNQQKNRIDLAAVVLFSISLTVKKFPLDLDIFSIIDSNVAVVHPIVGKRHAVSSIPL